MYANEVHRPPQVDMPIPTPEDRQIVARIHSRRIALMGDQQLLRARYEQIMRWLNPPWDTVSMQPDPRAEEATTQRNGTNIFHADLTNPVIDRWAVLQMGAAPTYRVKPRYVHSPVPHPQDPNQTQMERDTFVLDQASAQGQATQMENQTQLWADKADLHRTLLWMCWAKEAFGKAIIKTGWDPDIGEHGVPTAELLENPSTVYYGWSKRYGRRKLDWLIVADEMSPAEANRRFGLNMPLDDNGTLNVASWTGVLDVGEMDQRVEQAQQNQKWVFAEESWEIVPGGCQYVLCVAERIVDGPTFYPWKKLPFHVFENQHIPTWAHGKSTAEVAIPINKALDDMWDRQHQVIDWESGPRFKGMNMSNSGDEVDVPDPFHLLPLREGEDILQIESRIDFFPTQVHGDQMFEALHRSTGLTPIAWGMSPNAQTSGRAMSAEWRAVELPLTSRLVNMGPDIKSIMECWWDYAEAYDPTAKKVANGYRRFEVVWIPLDIRDKTEKTADVLNRLNGNILDPDTAIQETGYENSDEIRTKIEAFLVNPIWNPLRYQQYLTLQQLELTIRQQTLQVAQMEAAANQQAQQPPGGQGPPAGPPGTPGPDQLAATGNAAAGAAAQGVNPATSAMNQPGQAPGGGILPVNTSILSQTPLTGGIGNRAIVNPAGGPPPTGGPGPGGGPPPTGGQQPQ